MRGHRNTAVTKRCDASMLLRALESATARLAERVDEVNRLNVYPVPDGDTGTNMLHTMRSALGAARAAPDEIDALLAAAAHGSLMGARGNSGVILSQIIAGARDALAGRAGVDGAAIVEAFGRAREAAYQAVTNPVEGTILTAIRAMAEAVAGRADETVGVLLDRALAAGKDATARTPELLPVHKRAGVVDAGAQGLVYVLEGAADLLNGRAERVDREAEGEAPPAPRVTAGAGGTWGYDVQFLIPEPGRAVADLRQDMLRFGLDDPTRSCVLVVGDASLVRVHVHTGQPHEIIRVGLSAGPIRDVVVENLDEMAAERERATGVTVTREDVEVRPLAAVAVVSGAGLATVCRSLGVAPLHGGPTVNPSVEDLLSAIQGAPGEKVLVLPNDRNVLLAAQRAAKESAKDARVVPTLTMAQGMAALVAFDPQGELDAVADAMERAARSTRTLEVTCAVRDATVDGVAVRAGEHLALVDGRLVGTGASAEDALVAAARAVGRGEMCGLYLGHDADDESARGAAELLRATLGCEVEIVRGGQPDYPYIVSVE